MNSTTVTLNPSQRADIEAMYRYVLEREDTYGVAFGAHWELLACLDRHGIRCGNTRRAKEIACRIVNGEVWQ